MATPQYGFLGSGYGLNTLRQYGIDPLSWGKPPVNPMTGRNDYGVAPAGALQGSSSGAGSPATGFIPFAPSPAATSGQALAANLANIPALRGLFSGVAETYIPGASQKFAQEGANVNELLNPGRLIDTDRYSAEQNSARGIAGSPAGFSSAVRRTDEEILKRQLLGSQLLSSIAQRGEGMLPLPQFMVSPDAQYQAQWLANQLAAAPNPASAYNLAGANAALGLQAGMRAGYGRGGGGAPSSAATDVVNKYGPSVGITPTPTPTPQPAKPRIVNSPYGTMSIDAQGRISWPKATPIPAEFLPGYPYGAPTPPQTSWPNAQPIPAEFSPNWQGPVGPPSFNYDWFQ